MDEREKQSIFMYNTYGISEWIEKNILLSDEDKTRVLEDIKKDEPTDLLKIVKLPFPYFVNEYFKNSEFCRRHISDFGFGFKVYMLSNEQKERLSKLAHGLEIKKNNGYYALIELLDSFLSESLDDLSLLKYHTDFDLKFIYLTQYIGVNEAIRLSLKQAPIMDADGKAYEFDAKLDALNWKVREVVIHCIGLYGHPRKSIKEIAAAAGLPIYYIKELLAELRPLLSLPYNDFINKIGLIKSDYNIGEYRLYKNAKYKEIDLGAQLKWIFDHILSQVERSILGNTKNKKAKIYLAKKYLRLSDRDIIDYLNVYGTEVDQYSELSGHIIRPVPKDKKTRESAK